jgi:ABC-2 type transport system permease protein
VSLRKATGLVARREFSERLRQRAFRISIVVTVVLVAIVGVLAGVLGGDEPERYEVGAQGAEAAAIVGAARAVAPRFDARVEVRRFDTPAAAGSAVRDESVDVAVVGGTLLTLDNLPDELEQALQAGAREVRAAAALRAEGVSRANARRALDPPPLRVSTLEGGGDEDERSGVAFVASLLLYIQLIGYGLAVATGVVEEKASRVVEVLLAAIPARALLAGKLIGIGLLGLIQLLLVGVVGLAAAVASGALELDGATLGALGVALVWFLFGYALWASMFAVAGAIVSRQEDLQSSSTVLTMLLVVAYLVAFPVIDDPSSPLATISALVPLSSPIVMPALVALGEASAVEIAASLALLALSVAVLVRLGASIYEGVILRMGRPLKLTEAWRAARA